MAASNPTPPSQPKTLHKLLTRTASLFFVLAALFIGFRWYQDYSKDPNRSKPAETAGDIAAVQLQTDGQRVVVVHNGKVKATASWKPGVQDRDPVWSPNGNFIFFVSDRKENNFHVYRWNPESDDAEARTVGKRSRSAPSFPAEPSADANNELLVVSGGTVQMLNPKDQATPQVLPPSNAEVTRSSGEEGGTESQFSSVYGQIGNSFRTAKWALGKRCIIAVMRREDGEVLVIQDTEPNKDGKPRPPQPVMAGNRVDFDVSPKDGTVVFAVQGFQWPPLAPVPDQFKKGGKITTPFRHCIGFIKPGGEDHIHMMAIVGKDDSCFGSPAIAPDGSTVAVVVGPFSSEAVIDPKALVVMPMEDSAGTKGQLLARGAVFEPSWHPNGQIIAFARRDPSGQRAIFTVQKDGSSERNVTGTNGNFSNPHFSPQSK